MSPESLRPLQGLHYENLMGPYTIPQHTDAALHPSPKPQGAAKPGDTKCRASCAGQSRPGGFHFGGAWLLGIAIPVLNTCRRCRVVCRGGGGSAGGGRRRSSRSSSCRGGSRSRRRSSVVRSNFMFRITFLHQGLTQFLIEGSL